MGCLTILTIRRVTGNTRDKKEVDRVLVCGRAILGTKKGPNAEGCKEKYGWTDEIFDSIHWDLVGIVRKKLSSTK